ncbi:hypothetical protein OG2516_07652 [Oceanicola granulosus HTCC2516]|uniref:Cell division coordinator CpoB n=1 Tax=Oceanicola granulosus (strain ATCC BAA-861 / DSM 15982 / KCTC 12143 / HTCC2516) TaxID=314256 RepID=Q2CIC4_OCEGH|nr:tol-pal system protein YbgF [Oceanicola granulosus]EAR52334.1 hypothetical protein OG2516_07652 [Oceanicola granulosus HTCC2516]
MLRALFLTVALAAAPLGAAAQSDDETLADIRQELSVLFVEVQNLKRELSTTGAPGVEVGGTSALERLSAIEAELQRLTSKSEELEFRINRITRDGTNRLGDLEFRLCELEPGCDIGQLGDTPTLGGVDAAESLPQAETANDTGGPSLAVGEQADFERAQEALAAGDFRGAVDLFATHTETYPGGPLSAQAHFLRGEAHEALGEPQAAARAYLEAFSGEPRGEIAPDALFRLGGTLGVLGQVDEACVTLSEVTNRFPESDAALEAMDARTSLGCS